MDKPSIIGDNSTVSNTNISYSNYISVQHIYWASFS